MVGAALMLGRIKTMLKRGNYIVIDLGGGSESVFMGPKSVEKGAAFSRFKRCALASRESNMVRRNSGFETVLV